MLWTEAEADAPPAHGTCVDACVVPGSYFPTYCGYQNSVGPIKEPDVGDTDTEGEEGEGVHAAVA